MIARRAGHYIIDGEFYPSVTTILQVINKPALFTWGIKQAAEIALLQPDKYSTVDAVSAAMELNKETAMQRGTDVHQIAENYARNVHRRVDPDVLALSLGVLNPYHQSVVNFFQTIDPEVLQTELLVWNSANGYAGTLDLLANVRGRTFVIDYKTSKFVYPEYELQVEAYRQCTEAFNAAGEKLELKQPDAGAIVLFKTDGKFEWHETHHGEAEFSAFLAAKRLWQWLQAQR